LGDSIRADRSFFFLSHHAVDGEAQKHETLLFFKEKSGKSYTSPIAGFPARAALAFSSGPAQYRPIVSIAFSFFFLLYIFVLVLNFVQILKFVRISKFVQI
jgi:hypothetical protein